MSTSPWVNEQEASHRLGVSQEILRKWREVGYLKPGTHWRSSPVDQPNPWTPHVIYHLRWCKEIIEYWREEDAPISDIAA
tara:strand:- start:234 stop:473 length:240 start_codon:yes stop_codon:yes gene_type:complete